MWPSHMFVLLWNFSSAMAVPFYLALFASWYLRPFETIASDFAPLILMVVQQFVILVYRERSLWAIGHILNSVAHSPLREIISLVGMLRSTAPCLEGTFTFKRTTRSSSGCNLCNCSGLNAIIFSLWLGTLTVVAWQIIVNDHNPNIFFLHGTLTIVLTAFYLFHSVRFSSKNLDDNSRENESTTAEVEVKSEVEVRSAVALVEMPRRRSPRMVGAAKTNAKNPLSASMGLN
uniref:Uncharacterized protein n=1 Tax=Lotharella oceanica TaxID=641309 RepID=A0A7S2XBL6_9EUKA|mmetsp:Transcript_20896/g.39221  ORF Transcript_20896/g.39221 Transcript_20896/m.39221 type:complete len:232 (+) Transcript_20896:115-810(+)